MAEADVDEDTDCYKAVVGGGIVSTNIVQNILDLDMPALGELPELVVPEIITTNYDGFSCRTKDGDRGVPDEDYESFKRVNEDDCRARCALAGSDNCSGFEHTADRRGQCKIWKKSIGSIKVM
eukprot:401527_1